MSETIPCTMHALSNRLMFHEWSTSGTTSPLDLALRTFRRDLTDLIDDSGHDDEIRAALWQSPATRAVLDIYVTACARAHGDVLDLQDAVLDALEGMASD